MKIKQHMLAVALASLCTGALADSCSCCSVAPLLTPRSQGEDNVRLLIGQALHENLHNMHGKFYGSLAGIAQYSHTLQSDHIAESLFGNSLYCDNTLKVRGSAVNRNAEKDLLADWFYLSDTFDGTLQFDPRIQNFLVDFDLYLSCDKIGHGMYWELHAPLTWTKWDLNVKETIIDRGNVTGATGFGPVGDLASSFLDYSCYGKAAPSSTSTNGAVYRLGSAKICGCSQRKTSIADIQSDFGWNFFTNNSCHTGLYIRTVIPTGTRPNGTYLFEPIIGNGHHWEIGGGLSAHYTMWRDCAAEKSLGIFVNASFTHMVKTRQRRVFDLKGYGPLSRYMLLFNSASTSTNMTPAANITTADVKVKHALKADVVALFNYTSDCVSVDAGYNLFAKSREQIDCCNIRTCSVCGSSSACTSLDGTTWGPRYEDSTIHTLGNETATKKFSVEDLDIQGARTRNISHKLFTHISYNWWNLDGHLVPFLGIGAEVEFGQHDSCCDSCNTSASNSCCDEKSCYQDAALSQWGVWLKGGLSF